MGLFPGKEKMPIDEKLFNKTLEEYKFENKYAQKCIEDNRHNHITACYHLIDKRNKKIKDRQDNYSLTKMDFKKKMKMGVNVKDTFEAQANKTQIIQGQATDRANNNASPVPSSNVPAKVDMNMTVPLNSDHMA
jgi:hypothetical protein